MSRGDDRQPLSWAFIMNFNFFSKFAILTNFKNEIYEFWN